MAFDTSKKPDFAAASAFSYGNRAATISPNDSADALDPSGSYYKYIVAASSGDIAVIPYRNDNDDSVIISMTEGQVFPGRVRRVLATGTTATVVGWYD